MPAPVIAAALVTLGKAAVQLAVDKVAKFSRKQTEREFLEDVARWDRPHMGLGPDHRTCIVCGLENATDGEKCPGPPVAQEARRKLERLGR